MRQVFLDRPWIHQKEPKPLVDIFRKFGTLHKYPKNHIFSHGGTDGEVNFLLKGLVFFAFPDSEDRDRIFAILPPGRVIGDLDAITAFRINVIATTRRPSEVLSVPGSLYREEVEKDPQLLLLYTKNSICKEEAHMEGLMANFTFALEERLLALFSSIINAYYPLKQNDWNPLPLVLTTYEIADVVASNRSTISTIMNVWVDRGLARRDGRRFILHGQLFSGEYDWVKSLPSS